LGLIRLSSILAQSESGIMPEILPTPGRPNNPNLLDQDSRQALQHSHGTGLHTGFLRGERSGLLTRIAPNRLWLANS